MAFENTAQAGCGYARAIGPATGKKSATKESRRVGLPALSALLAWLLLVPALASAVNYDPNYNPLYCSPNTGNTFNIQSGGLFSIDSDCGASAIVSNPTHGTLTYLGVVDTEYNSPTWRYDATGGYTGTDTFTVSVSSSTGGSGPYGNFGGGGGNEPITFNVSPAAPVTTAASASTAYNTAATIDLTTHVTGQNITSLTVNGGPSHGTVSVSGEVVTYTPSASYYGGADSFSYYASNGGGGSNTSTVSITVGPPPAPTAGNQSATTPYNTSANIDLSTAITGVDITSIAVTSGPSHGSISISGEVVTYTPAATYYGGSDGFTYTATNPGGTSAPATVTITVQSPPAPTTSAVSANTAYNTVVTIDLTSSISGLDITGVSIGSSPTHGSAAISGDIVTYTPSSTFYGGDDTLTYYATNPGGNSAPSTITVHVAAPPAPTVSGVSPVAGPVAGGTNIVVTGTNFIGVSAVYFGATPASAFTAISATSLSAIAPAGTATVDVTVVAGGGTSAVAAADQFTYRPIPTISSVNPNEGPLAGGGTTAISGSGFSGTTAVSFGASAATSFTVVDDTALTVTVPAGSGIVDVSITTAGGKSVVSSADKYTYVPVPTVTGVSPATGPLGGGTTVTITGTDLTSASAVQFGALAATSFVVNSATSITAVSPAGAATVDIQVTTVGGTSASVSADQFSYFNPASGVALSSSLNPSVSGQSVSFTASVGGSAGTATGSVTFADGATVLGSVTLDGNGNATLSTAALSVGTHGIVASYSGDSKYTSSSQTLSQQVNAATTTTTLTATPNPVVAGQPVTLTATVADNTPQQPTGLPVAALGTNGHSGVQATAVPSGSVTFFDASTPLGTVALDGNGQATLTTSALGVGAHALTATYSGDATSSSSTQTLSVTVNAAVLTPSIPAPALSPWSLLALIGVMLLIGGFGPRSRRED